MKEGERLQPFTHEPVQALASAVSRADAREVRRALAASYLHEPTAAHVASLRALDGGVWLAAEALVRPEQQPVLRRLRVRAGRSPLVEGIFGARQVSGVAPGLELQGSWVERAERDSWPADIVGDVESLLQAVRRTDPMADSDLEIALSKLSSLAPTYDYDRRAVVGDLLSSLSVGQSGRYGVVAEWYGYAFYFGQRVGRRRREWPSPAALVELDIALVARPALPDRVRLRCLGTVRAPGVRDVRWGVAPTLPELSSGGDVGTADGQRVLLRSLGDGLVEVCRIMGPERGVGRDR